MAAANPIGYKFSWSPAAALSALQNTALYRRDGAEVKVDGSMLLSAAVPSSVGVEGSPDARLEMYPNRDSLSYEAPYGLEGVETMFRGTLRYAGFSERVAALLAAGFASKESLALLAADDAESKKRSRPVPWLELSAAVVECPQTEDVAAVRAALQARLSAATTFTGDVGVALGFFEWLGLLSASEHAARRGSPMGALASLLEERLKYGPQERDMVVMQHAFGIEHADGRRERLTATLTAFGEPGGHSAMARTVGFPVGISTALILQGKIAQPGVHAPLKPHFYEPVLAGLAEAGIELQHETSAWA